MNIMEIKKSMREKGIPADIMEQFVFPETDEETPDEKVAFAGQMEKLLTKEQILSIMEEQGCNKEDKSSYEFRQKHKDKPLEELIELSNERGLAYTGLCRLNPDGTLTAYWNIGADTDGKCKCVCNIVNKLSQPATVSLAFCGCCSGHIKYHFEQQFGLKLHLKETVSSAANSNGSKQCEHLFEIIK